MRAKRRPAGGKGAETHRDVIDGAEQQVSVGVAVDLGLPLKNHGLIVEGFDDLWLLLRTEDGKLSH